MSRSDETILGRWSRLKREQRSGSAQPSPRDRPPGAGGSSVEIDHPTESNPAKADPTRNAPPSPDDAPRPTDGQPSVEALEAVNIDQLDYASDFEPFMHSGVPDSLRTKALRKLWTTDPVFAALDGLDDCCADFSDAARVVPDLQTSYKVGQGFMTDAEVAVWNALGEPEAASPVAAAAPAADADGAPVCDAEAATAPMAPEVAGEATPPLDRDEAGGDPPHQAGAAVATLPDDDPLPGPGATETGARGDAAS